MASFKDFEKGLKKKGKFIKVSNGDELILTLDCEDVSDLEPTEGKYGLALEVPVLDEDGNKKKLSVKSDKVLAFLKKLTEGDDFRYGKTEPESGEGNGRLYAKPVKGSKSRDEDEDEEETDEDEEEETPKKKKKAKVEEDEDSDDEVSEDDEEDEKPKKKKSKKSDDEEEEESEDDEEEETDEDEDEKPSKKKKKKLKKGEVDPDDIDF